MVLELFLEPNLCNLVYVYCIYIIYIDTSQKKIMKYIFQGYTYHVRFQSPGNATPTTTHTKSQHLFFGK